MDIVLAGMKALILLYILFRALGWPVMLSMSSNINTLKVLFFP